MEFHSFTFVGFFVLIYFLYLFLTHRAQNVLLLVASYIFYGFWNYKFLILLFASTLLDYFCSHGIERAHNPAVRKRYLLTAITGNLGILFVFKYFNFFADSVASLMQAVGFRPDFITLSVLLPAGVSFYTFQTMSYTIDVYRRDLKPARRFLDFALFVSFFPQLVAGPIERATALLPLVEKPRIITGQMLREGFFLVLLGYFKKLVIADNMAPIADSVFNNPGGAAGLNVLVGVYAFAFQIYGDFSGYSDIARGTSRLLGFDLMVNFRMPYFAINPPDFWRRWHISLSTWLRDYLYIPLGGNRAGVLLTYRNLFLTMLIGGLWHGASWNFVAWGAFHGAILIVHRLFVGERRRESPRYAFAWFAKMVVMFHVTCLGWMLFRVNSLSDLPILIANLFRHGSFSSAQPWQMVVLLIPLMWIHFLQERSSSLLIPPDWSRVQRLSAYTVLFAYILLFGATKNYEFIYFRF